MKIERFQLLALSPFRSEGAKQINHRYDMPLSSRQVKYLKSVCFEGQSLHNKCTAVFSEPLRLVLFNFVILSDWV